jgi:small-conductance mechanosensitive channel
MNGSWDGARIWINSGSVLAGTVILALLIHRLIFSLAARISRRKGKSGQHLFMEHTRKPARFIFPLLALVAVLPAVPLPPTVRAGLEHVLGLGVIAAVGWALIALVELVSDIIYSRYAIDAPDNLTARRIRTQTEVMRRIVAVVVVVLTVASMLMTFPAVRHIGLSLLASAGVAGLVVGMAARSTLASLIAGVQVALTQPIRIEDAVVVEGEWGWIEEIETTYVVVRLWDLRRLILPLTYFIEKPFQNWTRTTAEILGVVMIYADYRLPVEPVRQELRRILEASSEWNKRVWALQVTDLTERTIQLRALMSASNSSAAFDLRCIVREKLIQFLQEQYPQCLPTTRYEELVSAGDEHQNGRGQLDRPETRGAVGRERDPVRE